MDVKQIIHRFYGSLYYLKETNHFFYQETATVFIGLDFDLRITSLCLLAFNCVRIQKSEHRWCIYVIRSVALCCALSILSNLRGNDEEGDGHCRLS